MHGSLKYFPPRNESRIRVIIVFFFAHSAPEAEPFICIASILEKTPKVQPHNILESFLFIFREIPIAPQLHKLWLLKMV